MKTNENKKTKKTYKMRPILHLPNNNQTSQHITNLIATKMDFSITQIEKNQLTNINNIIEQQDAALLIIGLDNNNQIQPYLNQCRNLRIPYIFIKNNLPHNYNINNIILPITNLEEEREKAPFEPILAVDICEHVYFLDYGFDKERFLCRFLPYLSLSKIDQFL